jgi:hypothetical protein
MEFKRGLNNRGQEGLTLTTVLLIVLGVVAVVVIILFVTGFFSKINGATDQLPSDLQAAVSACELAGSNNLQADYCSTFRKVTINGLEQYQTCKSLTNYFSDKNKVLNSCPTDSGSNTIVQRAGSFCAAQKLATNTMVDTGYCSGKYDSNSTDVSGATYWKTGPTKYS